MKGKKLGKNAHDSIVWNGRPAGVAAFVCADGAGPCNRINRAYALYAANALFNILGQREVLIRRAIAARSGDNIYLVPRIICEKLDGFWALAAHARAKHHDNNYRDDAHADNHK